MGAIGFKIKPNTPSELNSLTVSTVTKLIEDAINTQGSATLKKLLNDPKTNNFYMELDMRIVNNELLVYLRLMDALKPFS